MLKSLSASILLACTVFAAAAPVCVASAAEAKRLLTTGDNPFAQPATLTASPTPTSRASTKNTASPAARTTLSAGVSSKIAINRASADELAQGLVGIGPKKAQAIVDYRQQHGAFKQLSDLDQVKGIGPATLEKNKANISFE